MNMGLWLKLLLVVGGIIAAGAVWQANQFQMGVQTSNAYTNTRDLPSLLTGNPAPKLRLNLAEGGEIDLASLQGKTVLLTFWSSF